MQAIVNVRWLTYSDGMASDTQSIADYKFIDPARLRTEGSVSACPPEAHSTDDQVFVVFDDSRESAKLLTQLRTRPVVMSAGEKPIYLQVDTVARSVVEEVRLRACRFVDPKGKGAKRDLQGRPLFPESTVSVEIFGKKVEADQLTVSDHPHFISKADRSEAA